MRKKMLAALLAVSMVASMTACGSIHCMKVMLESSPLEENDCQKLRNCLAFPVLKRG